MTWLRSGLAALALVTAFAGCGGSSGASKSNFIGTWMYTSGTVTTTCMGEAPNVQQLTNSVIVSEGTSSDLVLNDAGCITKLDISGNTASVQPGQMCTGMNQDVSLTVTYTSITFTTTDGKTGTASFSANGSVVAGGMTVTCMVTGSGTLNKVAK
jgi:hypothetical protein